jgi:sugar O-acyltransferase (sialic acid O-acetyltransferase NeuD family)
MPKQPLILIGGGGHCKSCIEVIHSSGQWDIQGILDRADMVGTSVLDYKIVGTDEEIDQWITKGYYFLITVGQIKSALPRKRLYDLLKQQNALVATVVSGHAIVSAYAEIGEGTIIHHRASVNADAVIGKNCIINTAANIEHDVRIGDHTHISTGSMLNGNVQTGIACFIGSGSIISNGITIGNEVIVGAGSLVIEHLSAQGTYAGVPCKSISKK